MERVKRIESLCGKLLNLIGRDTPEAPWTGNSEGEDVARDLYRLLGEQLGITGEPATAGEEAINHPKHYNAHPSGIECIDVVEHLTSNMAAAGRYAWRMALKHLTPAEDTGKMAWYLRRERDQSMKTPVTTAELHFRMGRVVQADGDSGSPLSILLTCLVDNEHSGDAAGAALELMKSLKVITPKQAYGEHYEEERRK